MNCEIRSWKMDDADDLAAALNNKKIQDNLRDGLPFPYTENDAKEYIGAMLNSGTGFSTSFNLRTSGEPYL